MRIASSLLAIELKHEIWASSPKEGPLTPPGFSTPLGLFSPWAGPASRFFLAIIPVLFR